MKLRTRLLAAVGALIVGTTVGAFMVQSAANAHGAMMTPGSRIYLCWKDALTPQGNLRANNPACAAAQAQGGDQALYNWFGMLRADGAGRTRGFIPDSQICSGGNPTYSGYNLARNDWPLTHVTAGGTFNFTYNKWAAHPGTFHLYVTKPGFNPTGTLTWDSFESTPFLSVTDPPNRGSVGSEAGAYYWSGRLPSGLSGRHIIYSVWTRSDSTETFYNCSDVIFDGGNGEVTGVGGSGNPQPTTPGPQPTTPGPQPTTPGPQPTTPGPQPTTPGPGTGSCTATFTVSSSWGGGYQGSVTVTGQLNGWTVGLNTPNITQLWGGKLTQNGSLATVRNESWNGSGSSATFGFLANGTPPTGLTPTCSSP